jgi:hypothetical protein
MTEDENLPLDAAYDHGYRMAQRRYEQEIDYLKGQVHQLTEMNKHLMNLMINAAGQTHTLQLNILEGELNAN